MHSTCKSKGKYHHWVLYSLPVSSVLLPYYGYVDQAYNVMRSLSQTTRKLWDEDTKYIIKVFRNIRRVANFDSHNLSHLKDFVVNSRYAFYIFEFDIKWNHDMTQIKSALGTLEWIEDTERLSIRKIRIDTTNTPFHKERFRTIDYLNKHPKFADYIVIKDNSGLNIKKPDSKSASKDAYDVDPITDDDWYATKYYEYEGIKYHLLQINVNNYDKLYKFSTRKEYKAFIYLNIDCRAVTELFKSFKFVWNYILENTNYMRYTLLDQISDVNSIGFLEYSSEAEKEESKSLNIKLIEGY